MCECVDCCVGMNVDVFVGECVCGLCVVVECDCVIGVKYVVVMCVLCDVDCVCMLYG